MNTTIETVIIGAGQAGLSTGYHLQKQGRPFVILDSAARVGDQWRQQWDTLKLYTPAKYDGLPGLKFPGDPWSFPTKDQVGDYLEQYAAQFKLPIRFHTRVESLEADGRRRVRRHHEPGRVPLPERRRLHRHLRPYAERARVRGRPRPADPADALQRVPPSRPAAPRQGPGRRRLPLRRRHRL